MYGIANNTGRKLEGLGANGDGYSKFGNTNSKFYLSSYNDKTTRLRLCYNEAGEKAHWRNRSPWNSDAYSIATVNAGGGLVTIVNACAYGGISFGFCIN